MNTVKYSQSGEPARGAAFLEVCRLGGRTTLFYSSHAPGSMGLRWYLLALIARLSGWEIRRDRRETNRSRQVERRHRGPRQGLRIGASLSSAVRAAWMFTLLPSLALAEPSPTKGDGSGLVQPLAMIADTAEMSRHAAAIPEIYANENEHDYSHKGRHRNHTPVDPETYQRILVILEKRWKQSKHDPKTLAADIREMAEYMAGHPELVSLLESIDRKRWSMHYRKGQFMTDVRGSVISVSSAKVYFDPRASAELSAGAGCDIEPGRCIARPVDALIHELLHVQTALLKTREFLRDGGMNSTFYPHRHERKIIRAESQLYSAMSVNDQRERPHRQHHGGRLVPAGCATCVGAS